MFTVNFPVDIGTFVIVDYKDINLSNPRNLIGRLGSIVAYQCVTERDTEDNVFLVMVSGYKDAWCGEYLLDEVLIATEEQVKAYEEKIL